MLKNIFFPCSLFLFFSVCSAQDNWKVTGNRDGIRIYSKKHTDSRINAVKLETVFTATLSQITAVIADVSSYDSWVYNSRATRLLKQVSPSELYYYSEVIFPWPTTNRDFVSHIQISQEPNTKTVTVLANNVSGWEPPRPNLVRITNSAGKWILTPLSKNEVKAEYTLQVDPGGELPVWIINTFSSKGMVQTFKNLRGLLAEPNRTIPSLPFITD